MVVIGRRGRHVAEADALGLVFGYTCFNDGSVRDYQRKTHQWTPGKNFDGTGAIGPVVVTADELPPPSPKLVTLNGAAEAERAKRVGELFGGVFPGVTQYTTDVLFRDLWLRPDLAPRDRSLVTISALVASGQVAQLAGHVNIGMNNGLTQAEIAEAFTHLAFYVGWPNVFSAMPVAKEAFEKRPR